VNFVDGQHSGNVVKDNERGIHELYTENPVAADDLVWGRKTDPVTRRGFLTKGGLVAMSAAVGATIPFAHLMPGGLIPAAVAQSIQPFSIPGKEGLIILNDRPVNAETPAHLLDDDVTPGKHLFVRNNGRPPVTDGIDPDAWELEIGGEPGRVGTRNRRRICREIDDVLGRRTERKIQALHVPVAARMWR
jgi:hypothetical protein